MITLNISPSWPNVGAIPKQLESAQRKSIKQAQADTLKSLRAFIVRSLTDEYYLKAGQVRETIAVRPPVLSVRSGMLTLDKYKLSPNRVRARTGRPLMAGVRKAGGMKPLGPRAFLLSRGTGVKPFARVGSSRMPIKVLTGPSIAQLAGAPDREEGVSRHVEDVFTRRYEYWWGVNSAKVGAK